MSAIVVTGAKAGIGLELCKLLAKADMPFSCIVLAGRGLDKVKEAAEQVKQVATKDNLRIVPLELDVCDQASIKHFADELPRACAPALLSVLVNNAAVVHEGWTQESYEKTVRTNVDGVIDVTNALLPYIQPGGKVVHVSSGYGKLQFCSDTYKKQVASCGKIEDLRRVPFEASDSEQSQDPRFAAYKVSKALLNKLTQLQAVDPAFSEKQIAISAVSPGWCRTAMGGQAAPRTAEDGARSVLWNVLAPNNAINGRFFADGDPQKYG